MVSEWVIFYVERLILDKAKRIKISSQSLSG